MSRSSSSRPDFIASLSTWAYGRAESPFSFLKNTPLVFLGHADDDKGVPVALALNIRRQLEALQAPVHLERHNTGGHGAFHFMPNRSGARWPDALLQWLGSRNLIPDAHLVQPARHTTRQKRKRI